MTLITKIKHINQFGHGGDKRPPAEFKYFNKKRVPSGIRTHDLYLNLYLNSRFLKKSISEIWQK